MNRRQAAGRRVRRGQGTVEYMLVISVLVVALVAVVALEFLPGFREGFAGLRDDVGVVLGSGTRDGSGGKR